MYLLFSQSCLCQVSSINPIINLSVTVYNTSISSPISPIIVMCISQTEFNEQALMCRTKAMKKTKKTMMVQQLSVSHILCSSFAYYKHSISVADISCLFYQQAAPRPSQAKLYQASDFAHIHVHAEIQELFVLIGRHKPQDIELDTKFLPFIPDYIPAIGEIDPFIKVGAPQNIGGVEDLGLKVVDEPACNQSDPSVLEMSLRVLSKGVSSRATNNAKVENAEKNPKRITKWIESLEELHRAKPQAKVTYTNPMPDIDSLMQVWPPGVEDVINQLSLGSSDDQDPLFGLNLSTMELAQLGCALMDIPVHGEEKIVESLHLMFSVYQEFSQNAHFQGN